MRASFAGSPFLFDRNLIRVHLRSSAAGGWGICLLPPASYPLKGLMKTIVHPKKRGEWVELQFMARAAHHGLTVSKPWGDTARYDFIVEHRGRFQRVQVKSTTSCPPVRKGRIPGAYMCNTISRGPTVKTPGRSYLAAEID